MKNYLQSTQKSLCFIFNAIAFTFSCTTSSYALEVDLIALSNATQSVCQKVDFLDLKQSTNVDEIHTDLSVHELLQTSKQQLANNQLEQSLKAAERALAISKASENYLAQLKVHLHLAEVYSRLGMYSNSINHNCNSLDILQEYFVSEQPQQHSIIRQKILINLGNSYAQAGQYLNAELSYRASLFAATEIKDSLRQAVALQSLGNLHLEKGEFSHAQDLYNRALNVFEESGEFQTLSSSYQNFNLSLLINLGNSISIDPKDYSRALQYYSKALFLSKSVKDNTWIEGEANAKIAFAHRGLGNHEFAAQYYDKSLDLFRASSNSRSTTISLNNRAKNSYLWSMKSEDPITSKIRLSNAQKDLEDAIAQLDKMRQSAARDLDRISIFDTQIMTYNLLQQVTVAQQNPAAALEASEQGRARAFSTLLSAKNNQQDVPLNLQKLQQIAAEQNATLVEYALIPPDDFIHHGKQTGWDKASRIYIWVVQPNGHIDFKQVELSHLWKAGKTLNQLVQESRCFIEDCPSTQSPAAQHPTYTGLQTLHQILIDPIAKFLPEDENQQVIFIPQESLFLVPFAALQNKQGKYLIEKHTILSAPSIHSLGFTNPARATPDELLDNSLIVGDPTMPILALAPGQAPLAQLPNSGAEAFNIARKLEVENLLTKTEATKAEVVKRMAKSSIIHLATHGLLDYASDDPFSRQMPGALVFHSDSATHPTAGLLTTREIMDLDLEANLVVLSACDTGSGDLTGDGVVGLSRAFLSAGASSVLVSLWHIDDASTATLMTNFYQNLLDQPEQRFNKAQALRQAMLFAIDDDLSPKYWAAFSLIGEAE